MSEKRFVYYKHKGADYILDTPNTELDFIEMLGDALEPKEIVKKLNELAEENKKLKWKLEECKYHKLFSRRELERQNKELKERNNRQANTIEQLYNLIENKDWEGLTGIIEELNQTEEQL